MKTLMPLNELKGFATSIRCPKCTASTKDGTACAYPERCFHKGKTTSDGLQAVRNYKLKVWEYFRLTPTGYVKTGSTKRFEY